MEEIDRLTGAAETRVAPPPLAEPREAGTLLRLCVAIVAGIALFVAVDRAVFSDSLYFRWIAPASGLGTMAQALDRIAHSPADRTAVVVMGDSRIGEGFSAELATQEARRLGSAVGFANGAVAGSMPRVWYYMLRRVFQDDRRLAGVAIMLTSYHDNDLEPAADRLGDIVFVHPLLSLADITAFPLSFISGPARTEAVEAILFQGLFYKTDLQDFLSDPERRVTEVRAWRAHGRDWVAAYPGHDTSLAGLRMDLRTGQLTVPPEAGMPAGDTLPRYTQILHQYNGRPPDNRAAASYRSEWLGGIADMCREAGVKLYVFRIPRGPLHGMVDADEQPTGTVADLARSGRIVLLPATAFDGLERPEFFFDTLHMNHAGRELFSVEIARAIAQAG